MNKETILAFIKTKIHTVISTCGATKKPESALIGFGETEKLELIFGTFNTSRKYKNLKEHNAVAFVIGWDDDYISVQYEGHAIELTKKEAEPYLVLYHKKVPSAKVYHSHPAQTYWKVTPTWIRYSDLSETEEHVYELSF